MNTPVNFPYLPIISKFAEHPIVEGLSAMVLQFASSIDFIGDSTITYTPLAFTSDKAATQASPVYFDINKKWQTKDFPLQAVTVAALVEKGNSKMVVIVITSYSIHYTKLYDIKHINLFTHSKSNTSFKKNPLLLYQLKTVQ